MLPIEEHPPKETTAKVIADGRAAANRYKDEFLATLDQELRNPLAPIRNAVHNLGIDGLKIADVKTAKDVSPRQLAALEKLLDIQPPPV